MGKKKSKATVKTSESGLGVEEILELSDRRFFFKLRTNINEECF